MDTREFEFNGIKSGDLGVHIVRMGGRAEVPLWGDANISPRTSSKRIPIDAYTIERSPLEFTFTITLLGENGSLRRWTREDKAMLSEWLVTEDFKELRFGHDPNKVYYAIMTHADPLETVHEEGFITITMQTNSPYAWSDIFVHSYEVKNGSRVEIDALHNVGTEFYYPQIEVLANSDTVKIVNVTEQFRKTVVEKRRVGENFFMDGENKEIKSGKPLDVIFPHFNRVWFRLVKGKNEIEFYGCEKVIIKTQYPIM